MRRIRRYLAKARQRTGGLTCLRCKGRFSGIEAYDTHLVQYADEDWCHLPEEVGLVSTPGGRYRLPTGNLRLDAGIRRNGGVPSYPNTA